jgi:large subunit ribosomal protein L21
MYAIFISGGKQYRAKPGDTVQVELLDHNVGVTTDFKEVLLIGSGAEVKIGQPLVASATVTAEIIAIEKGPKIVVYHKKRRKQYDKKTGHRQAYTRLLVTGIDDGAGGKLSLTADERSKIMSNVGFLGDAWIDQDETEESPAAKKAPAKKAATIKSVSAAKAPAKKAVKKALPKRTK